MENARAEFEFFSVLYICLQSWYQNWSGLNWLYDGDVDDELMDGNSTQRSATTMFDCEKTHENPNLSASQPGFSVERKFFPIVCRVASSSLPLVTWKCSTRKASNIRLYLYTTRGKCEFSSKCIIIHEIDWDGKFASLRQPTNTQSVGVISRSFFQPN